ncbi:hypothetical protein [Cobetia sp. 5-25-4-2]|uniref:hypothetical protein n=1 Tax=Cobetia sp. 5-25-4-2 TaxID=2737459 RepID=UPI001596EA02|nr:hypothetical protein [Cobetia sp. 5-25-4-2]
MSPTLPSYILTALFTPEGAIVPHELIHPTLVNEAKRGDMRSLGEALCVVCDDIGMELADVMDEFDFSGLELELAKEALSQGRYFRRLRGS